MSNKYPISQQRTRSSLLAHLSRLCAQLFRLAILPSRSSPIAPVAVLIDGDNIASDHIAPILAEAGKFGGVTIRRVYGNWAVPSMQSWQHMALHYGLEQRHHEQVATGKNAADIALVIDAMDLLYGGDIHHFCIVTSDSDYTPLVRRLRTAGCIVIGIGKPPTPSSLSQACTFFISTEQLFPPSSLTKKAVAASNNAAPDTVQVASSHDSASPVPVQSLQRASDSQLFVLLAEAYSQEVKDKGSEWIAIPYLAL